jgi:hypothetical protein
MVLSTALSGRFSYSRCGINDGWTEKSPDVMSRLIYICVRNGGQLSIGSRDIEQLSERLTPDNIVASPPRIIEDTGILIGIINPTGHLPIAGCSVCLGTFFEHRDDWSLPGAQAPDGSYALFRGSADMVEVVSDTVASRTIWYAMAEELFIASTSQRAIVFILRSFQPNEAVYPWMLSSGTLGPGLSWDRRIRCLPGDARLKLDRERWVTSVTHRPVVFSPLDLPAHQHEQRLREAIEATFNKLDLDPGKWVLTLSGGYDSRAILLMLCKKTGDRTALKAVTWGLKSALEDKRSDAWVARKLARHYGIAHEYFQLDLAEETATRAIDRFLAAGEGRTDHISGYMDGFHVWKQLYESGVEGILRGDEVFGCKPVYSDYDVYHNMSLTLLSDYSNLDPAAIGLDQARPEALERSEYESREAWRDRINTEFEIPFVFSPLSDLKLAYVELAQPLLSRRIVETVRTLPDTMRTGKSLFRKLVDREGPAIRYAAKPAIQGRGSILRMPAMQEMVDARLRAAANGPEPLAALTRHALRMLADNATQGFPKRNSLPTRTLRWAKRLAGQKKNPSRLMDPYQFAFRAFIILRMTEILCEDANAPGHPVRAPRGTRQGP